MLRIVSGRESVDLEQRLFREIGASLAAVGQEGKAERIFLIVPDQYSLQAEKNAFRYLGKTCLFDLEVFSPGRLAARILDEVGGGRQVRIDQNGRHMLLSGILAEHGSALTVFRGMERSQSFIAMANDLVSELKQYDATPESLDGAIEAVGAETLLGRKLRDIRLLFAAYEERIRGKYLDSEDYIEAFVEAIDRSALLSGTEVWVYGFDFFAPKLRKILGRLAARCPAVHVVVTADERGPDRALFGLTLSMIEKLEGMVPAGAAARVRWDAPPAARAAAASHLERELYAPRPAPHAGAGGLSLCRAANFYAEAETAAAHIARLVREQGLRYRDIAVVCNDMEGIGPVLGRVFDEYGIPLFLDRKRKILHDPAVVFVTALLAVVADDWRSDDVFRLLKTGFCPVDTDAWELLENYSLRYRLRHSHWKKEFRYGAGTFGTEGLAACNRARAALAAFVGELEAALADARTARNKVEAILSFLKGTADLPNQLEQLAAALSESGDLTEAQEVAQIFEAVEGLLLQLAELLEDAPVSLEDLAAMLATGLHSLEIGILPPTTDQVLAGPVQRIRVGSIRALVVIGANDGILPAKPPGDDLLSQDERARLLARAVELGKDDDLRMMEEQLAIYRNVSRPADSIWVGCSASDAEGKELRPSLLFERLRRMFPDVPVEKDLRNRTDAMDLVERPGGTLRHLTEALRRAWAGEAAVPPPLMAAYNWYKESGDPALALVRDGIAFDNRLARLDADLARRLFGRPGRDPLTLTPSRLEKYGRCPFAHLVQFGFRPEERRVFEVAGREAGDVYHECLRRIAAWLTVEGIPVTGEGSPWMTVTRDACDEQVKTFMDELAAEYREGLLEAGPEERYRSSRMTAIAARAAWAMVEHVRRGSIRAMLFEEQFSAAPGSAFPPIRVRLGEHEVAIEGKIDRLDILEGGLIKVIDYKSGKESFDAREAVGGWRLQLLLYLKAALEGFEARGERMRPAGVFYFEISNDLVDLSDTEAGKLGEKLDKELRKAFRMDGILLNDPAAVDGLDGAFEGHSPVAPIQRTKDGAVKGTTDRILLSEAEFDALRTAFDATVQSLCGDLAGGRIDVRPRRTRYAKACDHCEFMSICGFDLAFEGCSYEVVA